MSLIDGRLADVIVEDVGITDKGYDAGLRVWADAGLKDVFGRVPGVAGIYANSLSSTKYFVRVDPRYDRHWVMGELEAAARIGSDYRSEGWQ